MTYDFNQAYVTLDFNLLAILPSPLSIEALSVIDEVTSHAPLAIERDVLQALYDDVFGNPILGVRHEDLYIYIFAELSQLNGSNEPEPKTGVDQCLTPVQYQIL
ncbi:MAG: hypothetical protein R3D66_02605 [Alphaproteobacteria bacterium]